MEMPGDKVRWSTVAVIVGIIAPMLLAASAWGILFEKVDMLANVQIKQDAAITSLSASVATLATSVAVLNRTLEIQEQNRLRERNRIP
jgi:Kef-type K+ transport system membrane component KefB